MPRKSAADIAVPTGARARLRPPPDLAGPEREVFLATVLACRADHFRDEDLPALNIFVHAYVRAKVSLGELNASGYVTADGKPSAWLSVLKDAERTISVYSRLLRLNPVARQASRAEPEVVSYYERMSMERADDADPN